MPFISAAELRRIRRDSAAFVKGRDSAAREVARLAGINRALGAEIASLRHFLNHDLPAEVANPARRIWELKAKVRELTADRAKWRSQAQVAERALANQMALSLSADGHLEALQVRGPDGEDTQTIDRSEIPIAPAELAQQHFGAKEGGIATLHAVLGRSA